MAAIFAIGIIGLSLANRGSEVAQQPLEEVLTQAPSTDVVEAAIEVPANAAQTEIEAVGDPELPQHHPEFLTASVVCFSATHYEGTVTVRPDANRPTLTYWIVSPTGYSPAGEQTAIITNVFTKSILVPLTQASYTETVTARWSNNAEGTRSVTFDRPSSCTLATTAAPTTVVPTTVVPTTVPTIVPTTAIPTDVPTVVPTVIPTTAVPTLVSTTSVPTDQPTVVPTTAIPTVVPTTEVPTTEPTTQAPPTDIPTIEATTAVPTDQPTAEPTTAVPTDSPTDQATDQPTIVVTTSIPPTDNPTTEPTTSVPPTDVPTDQPTVQVSVTPSLTATIQTNPTPTPPSVTQESPVYSCDNIVIPYDGTVLEWLDGGGNWNFGAYLNAGRLVLAQGSAPNGAQFRLVYDGIVLVEFTMNNGECRWAETFSEITATPDASSKGPCLSTHCGVYLCEEAFGENLITPFYDWNLGMRFQIRSTQSFPGAESFLDVNGVTQYIQHRLTAQEVLEVLRDTETQFSLAGELELIVPGGSNQYIDSTADRATLLAMFNHLVNGAQVVELSGQCSICQANGSLTRTVDGKRFYWIGYGGTPYDLSRALEAFEGMSYEDAIAKAKTMYKQFHDAQDSRIAAGEADDGDLWFAIDGSFRE